MLIQVVLVSGILLTLIYTGFKTVQTTIQSANSSSTSASFQDLLLLMNQSLVYSNACLSHLGGSIPTAAVDALVTQPNYIYPVTMKWPNGLTMAEVEPPTSSGAMQPHVSPDFKITQLAIQNMKPIGRTRTQVSSANGTQTTERYQAKLVVVAERRSQIMGGKEMRGSIDVFFQMSPSPPRSFANCTSRRAYLMELGPPTPVMGIDRKSGLECVDRGGTPVLHPTEDWYICRIPQSAFLNCESINKNVRGPNNHSEGWYCDPSISTGEVAYAY